MSNKVIHVVFAIEKSKAFKKYFNELFESYISPTVLYFADYLDEENDVYFSQYLRALYAVIFFGTELQVLGGSTQLETEGPTTSQKYILQAIKEANYSYQNTCRQAYILEALQTAAEVFKDLVGQDVSNDNIERCLVVVTQSVPIENLWAADTSDSILAELKRIGVKTSIISPHKMIELYKLFEMAGGNQESLFVNYAVQPQHLVLLNGLRLQEQSINLNNNINLKESNDCTELVPVTTTTNATIPNATSDYYNSTLPQSRAQISDIQTMRSETRGDSSAQTCLPMMSDHATQPLATNEASNETRQTNIFLQKRHDSQTLLWEGTLEFIDKTNSNVQMSSLHKVPCKINPAANSKIALKTDGWSKILHLIFLQKSLLNSIPNSYFQNLIKLLFQPGTCTSLNTLRSILCKGFGACAQFHDHGEMKMMILVYSVDKNLYVGFLPSEQTGFVALMKQIISSQPKNMQQAHSIEQNKGQVEDSNELLGKQIRYNINAAGNELQQQRHHLCHRQQQQPYQKRFQLKQQDTEMTRNANQSKVFPNVGLIRNQTCAGETQSQVVMESSLNFDWRNVRQISLASQRVAHHSDQPSQILMQCLNQGRPQQDQERSRQVQMQQQHLQLHHHQQQMLPSSSVCLNVNVPPRLATMRVLLQEKLREQQNEQ